MGFTPEQKELLSAKLDASQVRKRNQGGRDVSYIEGWHAIAEANRIFGFDGWSRETVYLKEVSRVEKNGKWKIGYEAKVRVLAGGTVKEGTGYGQGTMGDLFDAMESAGKEAETDAMKRALMTFGNPFGLALYDKAQANVETPEQRALAEKVQEFLSNIADCDSVPMLQATWEDIKEAEMTQNAELRAAMSKRKAEVA